MRKSATVRVGVELPNPTCCQGGLEKSFNRPTCFLSNTRFARILAILVIRHQGTKGYTNRVQGDLALLGVILPLKVVQDRISAARKKYGQFERVESLLGTPMGTRGAR
ncbi:hypothetical protein MXB_5293, partial [Myxobolus squamalis]